ncbi:MAG: aspartate-semialdehyde dehydrogenase [Myxococcaceae bacterium]|nr:aspartate-semialdehyde dehydrogenase [Myxococcaceae bacterium]
MKKLRCALVGATGLAGQQFIAALKDHPFFELTGLAASPRNAGKRYVDALKAPNGMLGWFLTEPIPAALANVTVVAGSDVKAKDFDLVFSAVESDVAKELEPALAKDIPVISAASAFRYENDVPLIIPPVNAAHSSLIATQRKQRGWKGFIAPIPNCTTTGLAVTLKPLEDAFGVKAVMMTSMQAVSGAGRSPGVIGLDIIDNVVPHISKEEHKVEVETKKILGGATTPHGVKVSCTCTRVAVLEGHTEAAYVSLAKKASLADVAEVLRGFRGDEATAGLPSAPPRWIEVLDDPFRPQPRLDRDTHGGMATSVGRLRDDGVLENGVKYVLVSHNTKMGAAKGAVLLAELLRAQGFLSQ